MIESIDNSARPIGIPWVWEKDYAAFLAICKDAHDLPATWGEFIRRSEEVENLYKSKGFPVVRAYIDPATFPDWCAANGCWIDTKGRHKFAASVAAKQRKNQS